MSKTIENLQAAFAGESQARNKYTYFAKIARKEGYHYIADMFEETADNECRHAKDHFKLLGGMGTTAENLQAAIAGEHYEVTEMYPQFVAEAKAEGNKQAATQFRQIARAEAAHEARYRKLLEMLENGTVFKRETPIRWKCLKCGLIHEGTEPPKICPACKHSKEYFAPANMDV
jgi:rubrerythrin